jgi:predicted Zn finger-like uncharacterized protein
MRAAHATAFRSTYMYAQCPHCKTVFRATATQLAPARGRVRCGRCAALFDAREHLYERLLEIPTELPAQIRLRGEPVAEAAAGIEPDPAEAPSVASPVLPPTGAAATPPRLAIQSPPGQPDSLRPPPAHQAAASGTPRAVGPRAPAQKAAEPAPETKPRLPKKTETELDPPAAERLRAEPRFVLPDDYDGPPEPTAQGESAGHHLGPVASVEAPTSARPGTHDAPLRALPDVQPPRTAPGRAALVEPEALLEDAEPEARHWDGLFWTLGVLGLVVLLGLQYAYFMRDDLAHRAELRPWLERMCAGLGCELALPRELSAIRMTHREVRSHPSARDALLVTATFVNDAPHAQPHPVLQITLFDYAGSVLARRQLEPAEYLGEGAKTAAGMAPGSPVNVVLELADPGRSAVGFQFDFL